jgi:hypothetical protein
MAELAHRTSRSTSSRASGRSFPSEGTVGFEQLKAAISRLRAISRDDHFEPYLFPPGWPDLEVLCSDHNVRSFVFGLGNLCNMVEFLAMA